MTVSTIKLKATNGGGSVALKGVANTAHDVELTMPSDIGTADQYLKLTSISGKTGTLAWQSASAGGASLANDANNRVTTADGSGGINGEANLTFDGTHLTIADGNLVIGTAGHGIDFSAQTATSETGATTTSELLDHYEEGTFTPVVKIGGSTTGITTESTPNGKYTRIGRMIHFACMVILTDKGSNSGQVTLENLPFACSDMLAGTSNDGGGIVWFQGGMNNLTTDGRLAMRFNSNQIEMRYLDNNNNTVSLTGNDLTDNSSWRMQGTYYV